MAAAEMVPESLGVVTVQPHGLPDPLEAVLGPAQPHEQLALLNQYEVVVGIQAKRPLLVIASLLVLVVRQAQGRENPVNVAVVVVQSVSNVGLVGHLFPGDFTIRAPVMDPALSQNAGLPRVRMGV